VYTSLRELQRGIAQRQVSTDDLLARGNQPPRPLGSIAELEPFFQGRAGSSLRQAHQPRTLAGVAPPAAGSHVGPSPAAIGSGVAPNPARATPLPPSPALASPLPPVPVVPRRASQPEPSFDTSQLPTRPAVDALAATQPELEPDPPTVPKNFAPDPRTPTPVPPPSAPGTPIDVRLRESMPSVDLSPSSGEVHGGPASAYLPGPHSRRLRSRWIAAIVLVGVLALLTLTVGRRYLEQYRHASPEPNAGTDVRVAAFLSEAEKKLEAGDFEGAREQLDKASVLAEKHPAVLAALARLEAVRADTLWLKLRLLDPADKQAVQSTHRQLGARVGKAKEAIDRALAVAPSDMAVVRARVDILRLAGDLKQARGLVAPLAADPTGENAYVLGALDLAEAQPVWSSVIDRLRSAVGSERGLGRAHAALVFALVRAGQVEAAQSELDKLSGHAEGFALYDDLEAFVARHAASASDAGTDAAAEVATVDPSTLPMLDTNAVVDDDKPSGGPGDFRVQLQQAATAFKAGNLDKAEQLYNAVLANDANNTEALAGLADVAKARHDPDTAAKMYDKVLKDNPSYLPALVARADQKWDSGDRKGALALYKRVLEQAGGSSSYGQKAAQRISEGESSPAPPTSAAPKASDNAKDDKPAPDKPKDDKPKDDKPEIDTSDLPGFQ
jgi:tetratricopeptide (TPR) repeat protein